MQKTVTLARDQHCLSRKQIDPDALKVLRRLQQDGHVAYLVGGSVRDLLLEREPKDFDISTSAHPNEIKKLFRNCFLIGRRFRLAHIRFGRDKVIETSTFRREPEHDNDPANPDEDLFHARDNTFGTPEEDARRRDFTVNGLFYELSTFTVIDHVGGLKDLKRKLIRSIGDADIRFREDPVRMVRAVRFASRLGFKIEPRTRRALLRQHGEITKASPARMLEELYKLFGFGSGEAAFRLLYETGLLAAIIPEIAAYLGAFRKRGDTPLWRCLAALDSGEHWRGAAPPALLWTALFTAPLEHRYAMAQQQEPDIPWPGFVDDLMTPILQRHQVPKRLQFQILTMLCNQERMTGITPGKEPAGKRFSASRFIQHAGFHESLALLEIRAAAGLAPPELAVQWRTLSRNEPAREADASPSRPDGERRPRRRRRRPRGNRSSGAGAPA